MNRMLTTEVVIVGVLFCPLAAIVAFLVTYEGYLRGRNPNKKLALEIALQTAFVALAVFAIIVVAIGFILARIIS